jgi:hypothetical protein
MHVRKLIRRHFAERLPEQAHEKMRAHLRICPSCRAEYDRIAAVLRTAAGGEQTTDEIVSLRSVIFAKLDHPATACLKSAPPGLAWWMAPALAVGLVISICFGVYKLKPAERDDAVQMRGGAAAHPLVDLQIFAVQETGAGYSRPRLVRAGGPLDRNALIQLRYLNSDPRLRYLYILGIDERFIPLDYFPRPESEASLSFPIQSSLAPQNIARSIRLSTRHQPGSLWIYALFSKHPLERNEIHARIARQQKDRAGLSAGGLDFGSEITSVVRQFQVTRSSDR